MSLIVSQASIEFSISITDMFTGSIIWKGIIYSILMIIAKGLVGTVIYFEYFLKNWKKTGYFSLSVRLRADKIRPASHNKPHSRAYPRSKLSPVLPYPIAWLVGLAMVARGEIGFLIASLSQSSGTLTLKNADDTIIESSREQINCLSLSRPVICTLDLSEWESLSAECEDQHYNLPISNRPAYSNNFGRTSN